MASSYRNVRNWGIPVTPTLGVVCASSVQAASVTPLPAGNIRRMLHLGANETDRIIDYPTSGQSILWDFITFAGKGPEYLQQPSPGQAVDTRLSVNNSNNTILTWTDVTCANLGGIWEQRAGTLT